MATKNRNGHIVRDRNFPVEDLYPDGQQAGQVGQEIYGSGAALIFATRAFHRIDEAPFMLFCYSFIRAIHRLDRTTLNFKVDGHELGPVRLALIPKGKAKLTAKLWTARHDVVELQQVDGRLEAWVPANVAMLLKWKVAGR